MAAQGTKLRLLYLYQILTEETDEEHILSAAELEKILDRRHDIKADRRSLYNDIDTLKEFGIDIVTVKGADHGYYVTGRDFELAELKVLADSIQVSRFITRKKSEELIKKLKLLTSVHQAKQIQKQITLTGRPKATNETIFYNVDAIHTAIFKDRQISFQYAEWDLNKTLRLKKNGALYRVSPFALIWDDENYYLVAYDQNSGEERHYRVDKMRNIEITGDAREGKRQIRDFDAVDFGKKTFGMFGGSDEDVTLCAPNTMAGILIDRFGRDIMLIPEDEEHFHTTVRITVSPQFFGWLAALGNDVTITKPESVRNRFASYLEDIMKEYR